MSKNNLSNINQKFEEYLQSNTFKTKSFHPIFENALNEIIIAKAKRFRPMLLLSVVSALRPLLINNSLNVALGIEILHTYSLIHDDLPAMDNASLRRGRETLHIKYDEVTAILVGDALNTHSFNLIANSSLSNDTKIDLIKTLSNDGGINGMVLGQSIDCFFENKLLDLKQLEFLHVHKTGKLIAASLKMGAIICNTNLQLQNELYNFGLDVGLLFQVQDDILDITQSNIQAGKNTSNDSLKNSFVNLLGLEKALQYAENLAIKCEETLNTLDYPIKTNLNALLSKYLFRHNNQSKKLYK